MTNRSSRLWQLRAQSTLFTILLFALLGLLAWFSLRFDLHIDLSANQRNSLADGTVQLLGRVKEPLKITSFISPINENREAQIRLFERFAHAQSNINFETVNPDLAPVKLREHGIEFDGETLVEYAGRSEKLRQIDESGLANAIQRLLRQGERWIVFLHGHGERHPFGQGQTDISLFSGTLAQRGLNVQQLSLAETGEIPANTSVLVIASPQTEFLPGEIDLIEQYVETGGNLLWLNEPGAAGLTGTLADSLLVEFSPGTIIDPNSQLLGLKRADYALVTEYPMHDITRDLTSLSLFPQAQGITFVGDGQIWQQQAIAQSQANSWNETGVLDGEIQAGDDPDEHIAPQTLLLSLTRSRQAEDGELSAQRIIVSGDGDFLSNRFIGNGANQALALNLVDWLTNDEQLIFIAARPAPDTELNLSQTEQMIIGFGFLLVLPALLLFTGFRIWHVRRKR